MAAELARHDAILQELREDILGGRYQPGERLPAEREIARRLGAHRSSVREALRKLEQLGLISVRHGGGATVKPPEEASLEVLRHRLFLGGKMNRPLLEELLEVHEMMVVGATRLAFERADAVEIQSARELLRRLGDPGASDDNFIDTAQALLELIVRASGNRVLHAARRAMDPLFAPPFREVRKRFRPTPERLHPIRASLDAALRKRDPEAGEKAVRRLLRMNRELTLDALDSLERLPGSTNPAAH